MFVDGVCGWYRMQGHATPGDPQSDEQPREPSPTGNHIRLHQNTATILTLTYPPTNQQTNDRQPTTKLLDFT